MIVDGHLQRVTHTLVVIRRVSDVCAHAHGRGRDRLRSAPDRAFENLDELGDAFVVEVDLSRFEGGNLGRGFGTVVDEFDTIEISFPVPPFSVLAPNHRGIRADVLLDELEWSGADRILGARWRLVERGVYDQRG